MTQATAEVVAELTRLYRELPPRPSEEELKEAAAVLASADEEEEEARLAEVDGEAAARAFPRSSSTCSGRPGATPSGSARCSSGRRPRTSSSSRGGSRSSTTSSRGRRAWCPPVMEAGAWVMLPTTSSRAG